MIRKLDFLFQSISNREEIWALARWATVLRIQFQIDRDFMKIIYFYYRDQLYSSKTITLMLD